MKTSRLMPAITSALLCASALAQTTSLGNLEIYHTGATGSFPLTIDNKIKLKIGNSRRVVLQLSPGDHMLESKLGSINPVLAVHIEPGTTTYAVLDYRRPNLGGLMIGKDPRDTMALTLEHVQAAPEGKFKDEEPDVKMTAAVSSLPPYEEPAIQATAGNIQDLSANEIAEALLQGRHTTDPKTLGVLLDDQQQKLGSSLVNGQGVSGYEIRVYSAKQWIELQGSIALREMRSFGAADLTPTMRKKLLYVVATPSTPKYPYRQKYGRCIQRPAPSTHLRSVTRSLPTCKSRAY